ncbi:DUF1190 domain-containing protein [Azotobacter chroococcum]|uniref:Lipoprotein n=1 Tax=Azotobacter chroococcum NCIMB 8003 TaxID=1328314 RepID=A0A0C4WVN5_9GAMM|nr:DUF1190 domain-containing protein [Azotobacter chroococcum]AJE22787.1 Hypothetical protein Achr_33820 [Azotobacter chroococcum NCIMB 8003]
MKRSRTLRLVLIGSTPLMLAGCEPSRPGYLYRDPASCIAAAVFDRSICQHEFELARATHLQSAPRYHWRGDCETDFGAGRCEPAPDNTGPYMPLMAGYLVGREPPREEQSGSGGGGTSGGGSARRTFASQPLYRSLDDAQHFRSADNLRVGSREGLTHVDADVTRSPAPGLVSRGGFGKSAARLSSFGS